MNKEAVLKITDTVDADRACRRLGVKPRSLRLARERGIFPASWFFVMKDECDRAGLECPETAFNFKSPKQTTPENAEAGNAR